MDYIRSILYIPAYKEKWVKNATSTAADGIILDLEDSVPEDEKSAARNVVLEHRDALEARETVVTLRVNEVGSEEFYEDIDVVGPWLDAIVIPKAESAAEVRAVESILEFIEHREHVDHQIEIVPLLESAEGVSTVKDIASSSDRVAAIGSSTSRGGDIQQSVGLGWSPSGEETLHIRSKIVLEARAAGVDQLFSGIWATVDDEDGLRKKAERQKRIGFTGMQVIHPGQIESVNDAFTPSEEELSYYRDLIEAFEREQRGDQGAIKFDGEMVDAAKVKQARRILERADESSRQ